MSLWLENRIRLSQVLGWGRGVGGVGGGGAGFADLQTTLLSYGQSQLSRESNFYSIMHSLFPRAICIDFI